MPKVYTIWIEIQSVITEGPYTGIPKTIYNIAKELINLKEVNADIDLLRVDKTMGFLTCNRLKEKIMSLEGNSLGEDVFPKFKSGDVIFLPSTGYQLGHISTRLCVIPFLHDIIPITHPAFCEDSTLFKSWVVDISNFQTGIICNSVSTVKTFINKFNYGYPIGYVHLGCEKEDVEIKEIFLPRGKNVLMVSTIEPRKMYAKTIEQFERIWEKREDINLIIVGKKGWLVDELMEKIRTHPRRLTNLFHLTGLNESELNYLYKNADLFLFASEVEGFGLGVIEAGRFGTPLLLRDIPVFREIAGDHATYFDDFKNLPSIITDGLDKGFRRSDKMKVNSWKDTSVGILTLINDIRNKWIKANNSHLNSPSPLLNA